MVGACGVLDEGLLCDIAPTALWGEIYRTEGGGYFISENTVKTSSQLSDKEEKQNDNQTKTSVLLGQETTWKSS